MLYEFSPPQTKVEQILAHTRVERLTKIYNLPMFNTTLEFLTMLALVPAVSFPPPPTSQLTLKTGRDTRRARRSAPSTRRLEPPHKAVPLRAARRARAIHDPRPWPRTRHRAGRRAGRRKDRQCAVRERAQRAVHAGGPVLRGGRGGWTLMLGQPDDAGMGAEDVVRGGGGMQIDEDDDTTAPYAAPLLNENTDWLTRRPEIEQDDELAQTHTLARAVERRGGSIRGRRWRSRSRLPGLCEPRAKKAAPACGAQSASATEARAGCCRSVPGWRLTTDERPPRCQSRDLLLRLVLCSRFHQHHEESQEDRHHLRYMNHNRSKLCSRLYVREDVPYR